MLIDEIYIACGVSNSANFYLRKILTNKNLQTIFANKNLRDEVRNR